ncbi:MAG: 50S ribosomal protein L9 [Deltaproteobacteria bacterium]|nr:50S ribosomal protein L9 [Deltaproteobacteria bacterium]
MKVILKETIESLGIIGSEVDVKNGYARNFLMPQGKAVLATDANRKQMLMEKKKIDLQMAKERKTAEEMAASLEGISCRIAARVADEDRLYGSVTVKDIADALSKQGIEVQKRMILLSEPIKTIGTFSIPIRIYRDIEPEISVEVVPE